MVNGRGGPRDHFEAARHFARAAELGHGGAMFGLGALYGGGHDVPMDRAAAFRWFRQAAERSHPQAQLMLGRYLRLGLAGPPDTEEARIWFKRALDSGISDAATELANLNAAQSAHSRPEPIELTDALRVQTVSKSEAGAKSETGPQLIHH
jgi:TPR repeat protein